ncbi:hypothetical protein V494_06046 [Pseudogymnoascus sp. VKM F-4513 (FW-928)]|nr:hypothetical protein V494_06046 [Pseudogymnoascus sp. VKM F-4513 (FW-928)]
MNTSNTSKRRDSSAGSDLESNASDELCSNCEFELKLERALDIRLCIIVGWYLGGFTCPWRGSLERNTTLKPAFSSPAGTANA